MLRGLSASVRISGALVAAGLLLSGCTSFSDSSSSSTAADTSGASCSGAGEAAKITPPSQGLSGIVAHGSCSVVGVPDTATLLINVETQGPTARAATDAANGRADAVIGALRGKGLQQNDVRAGQLLVNPIVSPVISSPVTGVGGTRITGFTASRLISATVRTIASAAAITSTVLDTAGDAGRVQLSYSIANDETLRAQARTAAVKVATEKARNMAEAAGTTLGQLVSITEVPPTAASFAPSAAEASGSTTAAAASAPKVEGDGQLLEVAVDVVYAIG
jgi:uncharacterized protein YggE